MKIFEIQPNGKFHVTVLGGEAEKICGYAISQGEKEKAAMLWKRSKHGTLTIVVESDLDFVMDMIALCEILCMDITLPPSFNQEMMSN